MNDFHLFLCSRVEHKVIWDWVMHSLIHFPNYSVSPLNFLYLPSQITHFFQIFCGIIYLIIYISSFFLSKIFLHLLNLISWFYLLFSCSSVQLLSHVQLFVTLWTAAHQASLSITNSRSLFKLMSIESVMPSNHLILCCPLLLLPSIFPSLGVFSNESVLCIRWSEYWCFNFSISPFNEYSGLISFRTE